MVCSELWMTKYVALNSSVHKLSNHFVSTIWLLGPRVFRMSPILITHMFSGRSRFLMSNIDNISLHFWAHCNTNVVASFWVRYFILLVFILEVYEITIPTSHVKLYFERADMMLKTPFINLVMTGCWPSYFLLVHGRHDWTVMSALSLGIFCSCKHLLTHKKPSILLLECMESTFSYMEKLKRYLNLLATRIS